MTLAFRTPLAASLLLGIAIAVRGDKDEPKPGPDYSQPPEAKGKFARLWDSRTWDDYWVIRQAAVKRLPKAESRSRPSARCVHYAGTRPN
jgi:hypothetical protein